MKLLFLSKVVFGYNGATDISSSIVSKLQCRQTLELLEKLFLVVIASIYLLKSLMKVEGKGIIWDKVLKSGLIKPSSTKST